MANAQVRPQSVSKQQPLFSTLAQLRSWSSAGKAKKKFERAQRMSLKKAIASGGVDLDMADAVDVQEKANN